MANEEKPNKETFDVQPKGFEAPIISLSDEWVAMQAIRRGVDEQKIIDALNNYKQDIEEKFDAEMLCNGEIDMPRIEDYLPVRVVDSVRRLTEDEVIAVRKRRAEQEKQRRERAKEVHRRLREKLGMTQVR